VWGTVLFLFFVVGLCLGLNFVIDGALWSTPKVYLTLFGGVLGSYAFILHQARFPNEAILPVTKLKRSAFLAILPVVFTKDGATSIVSVFLGWQ
jgi:hypothetical protein